MFVQLKQTYKGQAVGTRISVDDEDGSALIKAGVAEAVANDPIPELVARSLETHVAAMSKAFDAATDELLKRFAAANTLSRKSRVPAVFGEGGTGDEKKTFGAFLLAVRDGDTKALEEMGSQYVEWNNAKKSTLTTNVGTAGGFLVPTEHYGQIMTIATEQAIVRPRAMIIPMAGREFEVPYLDITDAPTAGDSAFLGGLVARWSEEGDTVNETEPAFKQAKLRNHELSGFSKITNSLNADAPGLEAFLFNLFGQAAAWYEDYAFLRGDGAGKPLGYQTWTGFVSVARSAASAFGLTDYGNILGKWLGTYNPKSCCWVGHPTVIPKLTTMSDASGRLLVFGGGGAPNVAGKVAMSLGGLPFEVSEKVPALNTAGDVGLYDFARYLIGDRQQMEVAFSGHAGFTTNSTYWRFVSRVAGMPWMRDKITLSDASSTLSPAVGLAAG